jgi:hypothetical protein
MIPLVLMDMKPFMGFLILETLLILPKSPTMNPKNLWRMHLWQHCKPLCPQGWEEQGAHKGLCIHMIHHKQEWQHIFKYI